MIFGFLAAMFAASTMSCIEPRLKRNWKPNKEDVRRIIWHDSCGLQGYHNSTPGYKVIAKEKVTRKGDLETGILTYALKGNQARKFWEVADKFYKILPEERGNRVKIRMAYTKNIKTGLVRPNYGSKIVVTTPFPYSQIVMPPHPCLLGVLDKGIYTERDKLKR